MKTERLRAAEEALKEAQNHYNNGLITRAQLNEAELICRGCRLDLMGE